MTEWLSSYEMTTIFGHSPTISWWEHECLTHSSPLRRRVFGLSRIYSNHHLALKCIPDLRPPQIQYGGSLMVPLILLLPRRVFDLASVDLHTMGIVVVSYTIKVIKVPISKSDFSFESFRMWKTQRATLMQWGWPKQPRQILIEICCFFSNLSKEQLHVL